MGWIGKLLDRIETRIEKPADPELLDTDRNPGSESMAGKSSEDASAAGQRVRRSRDRRRWRWGPGD